MSIVSPCLFRYGYTSPACSNLAQLCSVPLTFICLKEAWTMWTETWFVIRPRFHYDEGLCPALGFSLHSSKKKSMIQSDCNLGPNILKPIKNEHDTPLGLSTLSCLRHSMVSSVGPFGIHSDGPESGLTLKALLYVTFSSFVT